MCCMNIFWKGWLSLWILFLRNHSVSCQFFWKTGGYNPYYQKPVSILLRRNYISLFLQIQSPRILLCLTVMKQEVLTIPQTHPQEVVALDLLWLGVQASGPEEMVRTGMRCLPGDWLFCSCLYFMWTELFLPVSSWIIALCIGLLKSLAFIVSTHLYFLTDFLWYQTSMTAFVLCKCVAVRGQLCGFCSLFNLYMCFRG